MNSEQRQSDMYNSIFTKLKILLRGIFQFDISQTERKETIDRLIEESRADNAFYIFIALSTIITVCGLLTDSMIAVLGGMLVAPLLTPILAFGMAVVTAQPVSLRRSLRIITNSIIVVILLSTFLTLLFNFPGDALNNKEILSRTTVDMLSLYIALASGLAAAFAWSLPKMSASLPGVAVATSLIPPLAVSGIGLAFFDRNIFFGSFQLFLLNLFMIVLASSMVFSLFGFSSAKREEAKKVKEEIKEMEEEKKELEKKIKEEKN